MNSILSLCSAAICGVYTFHFFQFHDASEPGAMVLGVLAALGSVIQLVAAGANLAKGE